MSYVVWYYRKSDGQPSCRHLRRGFACTRDEMPGEMATICRADRTKSIQWTWIGNAEHGAKLIANAAERGLHVEPTWPSEDYE